jgi:peroxiredoxin
MAIEVGSQAPDFTLLNTAREEVTLSSLSGEQVVVLAFYPAAFTGVCEKEMCTFRDSLASFNDMNAAVLGISVDGVFSNKAFAERNDLNFPVLSDYERKTVTAYGVALADFAGMKGYTASHRAVFVIGKDGLVKYVEVTENPGVEPDYDAVSAAVKALG